MDRRQFIGDEKIKDIFDQLQTLNADLNAAYREKYDRSLPFEEALFDRWERAKALGFGSQTSIYQSSFVFGKVVVGSNCWIGPHTIIDGSGSLCIGDNCTISAGVHIYTHDNVKSTLSSGLMPIERDSVKIGNNVYIAPNVVISKGVVIGDFCVIGAMAFINSSVPSNSIVVGQPGRIIGSVEIDKDEINFNYYSK